MTLSVSVVPSSRNPSAMFTCPDGCWPERDSCYCPRTRTWTGRAQAKAAAMQTLGIIPDFQFHKPPYNPEGYNYTDKLQFTSDVPNQLTVQPVFPNYPTSGDRDLQGVGAFDSWWWTNRKWIAIGTIAAVGLGLLAAKALR